MNESVESSEGVASRPPKISRLVIASFIMTSLAYFSSSFRPVFLLSAMICGIVAWVKTNRLKTDFRGKIPAIIGVSFPLITVIVFILIPFFHIKNRLICGTNLKGIGIALNYYAEHHDGKLPEGENWCDALMTKTPFRLDLLICSAAKDLKGESSYAMNIHAEGKERGALPGDMVLIFETNVGLEPGPRTHTIQYRSFFQFFKNSDDNEYEYLKDRRVYSERWNQVGGPETLTIEHHGGEGCHILFADGYIAFILANQLGTLRWTE